MLSSPWFNPKKKGCTMRIGRLVLLAMLVATLGCGDLAKKKRGSHARGRAVSAITSQVSGTSFITNVTKGTVTTVDNTSQLTQTINTGSTPTSVAFTLNNQEAWVSRFATSDVGIISTANGTLVGSISTRSGGGFFGFLNWGIGPNAVAFSPDGKYAYVVNFITANVSIIDTASKLVVDTIRILPNGLLSSDIAVTPDGKVALVSNLLSSNVSVLDLASKKVIQNITVPSGPMAVAISADGLYGYVACSMDGKIAKVDLVSKTVVAVVESGVGTSDLAVSSDGIWTYATNFISGDVVVIDNRTNMVATKVLVGSNLQSVLSLVGVNQSQGTQVLFSQFLKYLGSSGGGLSTVFAAIGVNPNNQQGSGSQTILQVLLGAFLQYLGVNNQTTQQIIGGSLQGVITMGIGCHGIAVVPGSTVVVVSNFLTGNVSHVDTVARTSVLTKATAGLGANSIAITAATVTSTQVTVQAPSSAILPSTPASVTVSAVTFPATVGLNAPITLSWDVSGANTVTHANIHLDTARHSAAEWEIGIGKFFGSVETGSSGAYKNDFVAPGQASTFYFVIHVQADGKDYYSTEYKFEVK